MMYKRKKKKKKKKRSESLNYYVIALVCLAFVRVQYNSL